MKGYSPAAAVIAAALLSLALVAASVHLSEVRAAPRGDPPTIAPGVLQAAQIPNAKEVTPVGEPPGGYISPHDTLRYRILFQNLTADTVDHVTIIDTLDADLDTATLQVMAGSHPFTFSRNGLELTWMFASILLPDSASDEPGSHGSVEYSIVPYLPLWETITIPNTAHIYFDSHPVVTTNTVLNTITHPDCLISLNGDVNNSSTVSSADIIALVNFCFKSGPEPMPCEAAGDVNCDGAVTAGDVITIINFVFKGGGPPCDVCVNSPLIWSCT